eukprot:2824438-Pyramimonas_sp.AAC.1
MRSRVAAAALQSRGGAPPEGAVPPAGETVDAGRFFRRFVLSQCKSGHLTARSLATACYWATLAGAIGVEDLGLHPDRGHASEHARAALSLRSPGSFYVAQLPIWEHGPA